MIESYQNKSNIGIGFGLLLSLGSRFAAPSLLGNAPSPGLALVVSLVGLFGTVLFIYGCVMYALAKGRNGWWGAFGLLSIIGLIVLVCLRDDAKGGYAANQRGFEPILPGGPPRMPPRA